MEQQTMDKAITAGKAKVALMDRQLGFYLLRSVLAGLYLGLIVFLYWNLSHNLAGGPFGKVVASLFFGVGLYIIVFTQSELFTSNNMYLTVSSLAGATTWRQCVKLWTICYVGNWLGALLIGLLLLGSGSISGLPVDHALFNGALHKVEQSGSVIFFKGILANWVVCLAVWVSFKVKEDLAKLVSIVLVVFIFLYLGFEHSIANLATFSYVVLSGHGTLTAAAIAHNLIWSTLGNIVGGGVFVGFCYWSLSLSETEHVETEVKHDRMVEGRADGIVPSEPVLAKGALLKA